MKPKKIFLSTYSYYALLLGGLILLSSCGDEALKKKIESQGQQIATLNDSITKLNDLFDRDKPIPKKPKEIISLENAIELYNSYSKNRACVIEVYESGKGNIRDLCKTEREPEKIIPTRSSFIEYRVLKQYLAYVEQETFKRKIPITGFRFYFSNYPDKENFDDGRPIIDRRRNTFFAAPTIKKGDEDLGFTIFENSDGNFETRILEEVFNNGNQGIGYVKNNISKASFFSFQTGGSQEISLSINELGGHPPKK